MILENSQISPEPKTRLLHKIWFVLQKWWTDAANAAFNRAPKARRLERFVSCHACSDFSFARNWTPQGFLDFDSRLANCTKPKSWELHWTNALPPRTTAQNSHASSTEPKCWDKLGCWLLHRTRWHRARNGTKPKSWDELSCWLLDWTRRHEAWSWHGNKMLRQAQRLIIALTHAAQNMKLAQNKNVEMSSSAENDKKLMGTELTLALHQNAWWYLTTDQYYQNQKIKLLHDVCFVFINDELTQLTLGSAAPPLAASGERSERTGTICYVRVWLS